jgi:hypothetical protein
VLPSELASMLRRVLTRPTPPIDEARRDAELDALTLAHARKYGERRSVRTPRWLWVAGLATAAAVGACVVPIDYQAEMGQRLAFTMPAQQMSDLDLEGIARFIEQEHDPEEIRIMGHAETTRTADGGEEHVMQEVRVEIEAVGEHLEADALWDDLVDEFPVLADAQREDEALQGLVHGTLGGRLSHRWLDVTIDRDGVEEAKRRLIEELAAQGVTGTPQIEIIDEESDGMRRREVRVRIEE